MKKTSVVASVLCLMVFCVSGCDLGTYNKRLNERGPAVTPDSGGDDGDAPAASGEGDG
ncbi:MAG: hypothetical protein P8J27_14145 [Mariniblastus sp.]|nr:hypothetical protein [Mariniblastus sp.]